MSKKSYWEFHDRIIKKQVFFLFFILLISSKSLAQLQNNIQAGQFYKIISFDEKIDFGEIDSSVLWTIINTQRNTSVTLHGNAINDYIFHETGEYEIRFNENIKHSEACNHPLFAEKFLIKVQPLKLSFDFSGITFSQKLQKNVAYTDLIVTVPVEIALQNNPAEKVPCPEMSITGIGVSLSAKSLNDTIVLSNRKQLLKYKVSGKIEKETFLMFDFYDFNNQAHTYNLSQKIK